VNFIKDEMFILTISGAFAHNKIYRNGVAAENKIKFRDDIRSFLGNFENKYKNKITEEEHLVILDKFKKDITIAGKNILEGSSISFGTVQKILNLYLKYLWCLGLIVEPPHCPIDRTILNIIKDYKTNWTKMKKKEYQSAIEKIKSIKGYKNIASWELDEFRRKN
jgi:hypothetical protein